MVDIFSVWFLFSAFGYFVIILVCLVVGRFALLTWEYKSHNNKVPNLSGAKMTLAQVPRLNTTFTIAYWGDPNGSFEQLIDQMLDENGHAKPVTHHVTTKSNHTKFL